MGIKLVIVDDAPFIREVIKNIFRDTDVEVVGEATTGVEAIEVVVKTRPQVVLMDIVMPTMNGIAAATELLHRFPNLKIIACTTLDQELMIMKALEAGCCSFVLKPFKADELIKAVQTTQA
ncbi:MAG: response regulator [Bdellovibrionales bacterium]|nr:response regulator [Bdellovibrionales bacterium]